MVKPRIYWLDIGPLHVRIANFDFQFSKFFNTFSNGFRIGKGSSWTVSFYWWPKNWLWKMKNA